LEGANLTDVVEFTHEQLQRAITNAKTQLRDYLKAPPEKKEVSQPSKADVAWEQ
jgi:hypothetical protein